MQSSPISALFDRYRQRFQYHTDTALPTVGTGQLRLVLVIPCYDEHPEYVLESLSLNAIEKPESVLVLLVFNHAKGASADLVQKHVKQADKYRKEVLKNGVALRSIKAFDLPPKQAGVGMARKRGMDLALALFAQKGHDGLIVCLDADCKVSENYLESLLRAERHPVNGLSIAFEHPEVHTAQNNAILKYEVFLRYYVQAWKFCGFAHAHHTIGSGMACRASAYAKIGGMNKRKAGEDFYFLHKLMPQGSFYDLTGCKVFPQARFSSRVPFGTGKAMLDMFNGKKDFKEVYNPFIFKGIKQWLESVGLSKEKADTPGFISAYLMNIGLEKQLLHLRERSGNEKQFARNFSFWFDGFKMLKLVHFARDHYYGDVAIPEALEGLFNRKVNTIEEAHRFLLHQDLHTAKQPPGS